MIETEVKYYLGDKKTARAIIAAAGLEWIDGEYESNRIFDTSEGRLRREESVVRLRTRGSKTWLTYKQKTPQFDGIAKVRIEHEMEVSSPEAAGEFLTGIGLVETLRYDKYRAEYELQGTLLLIDRLPGGWFCEIEGDGEAIACTAEKCGLDRSQMVALTYPEICRRLFDNKALPAPAWIFPAQGQAEVRLPVGADVWWGGSAETT